MNQGGASEYLQGKRALLIILCVGLVARLTALLLYLGYHGWRGETWEYEEIANNLVEGRGFVLWRYETAYKSFVVPMFPLICAFLHRVGGPGLWLYYAFHLSIALGIIWLTYAIALRWYGMSTAVIAAVFVALEPGLIIFHSYKVDVIALSTFLLLLGVYLFALIKETWDRRLAVLVGFVVGIGILTRPDLVSLLVVPAAWMISERKRFQEACTTTILILLATAVVLTPWFVRNYNLHGRFVLTTINGENLWMGNNPSATGTTVRVDSRRAISLPKDVEITLASLTEIEQDAFFRERAFNYIVADPVGFLSRALAKMYYFWWFSPTFAKLYYDWASPMMVIAYRILYGILLGFGVIGVWASVGDIANPLRRVTSSLLALPMAVAIIHSIYFVEGRHRILVMPIILLFAAHGIIAARGKLHTLVAVHRRSLP